MQSQVHAISRIAILFIAIFGFSFILNVSSGLNAQETNITGSLADLEPFLEKAKESGSTVIVVAPGATDDKNVQDAGPGYTDQGLQIRAELRRIFTRLPDAASQIYQTLLRVSPDGKSLTWLLFAVSTALASIIAAHFAGKFLATRIRNYFKGVFRPNPKDRAEKISYLLFRAFMGIIQTAVAFGVGMLVAVIFDTGHPPARMTILVIIVAYVAYRFLRFVVFFNLFAPDAPSHRMLHISDEAAERGYREWILVIPVVAIALGACAWMAFLGLDHDIHKLMLLFALTLSCILFTWLTYRQAADVRTMILNTDNPSTATLWRRAIAGSIPLVPYIYIAVAWAASSSRLLLNLPSAFAMITAPIILFVASVGAYAIAMLIIDKMYERKGWHYIEQPDGSQSEQKTITITDTDTGEVMEIPDDKDEGFKKIGMPVFKDLFEHAAGILIGVTAIATGLAIWGVDLDSPESIFVRLIDVALIIFAGYMAYKAVRIWVDAQIEDDEPIAATPGEEMTGKGASRLATLLPLFRNFLLITIVVMTTMIALSQLGVDIAPLFAGAGVIGLAIGFGAQTLIRDIFSGAFFLMDDAFRRGEYIDLGIVKGTVEKISIRSFQLRHHKGPLHTVPFGEIQQLTNYSRDWVLMKLPLRVTYDTDVEKVRKLIKNLGKELQADETIGHMFLQPLKSQGVYQMEDSAIIIRVKFMTKPGDQFMVRKQVYARIREVFNENGVKFAHRQVTVHIADHKDGTTPTDEEKRKAAAGAVNTGLVGEEAAPAETEGR